MSITISQPFSEEHLYTAWTLLNRYKHQTMDDFGPQTYGDFVDHWKVVAETELSWEVWRDEDLVGLVTFRPISPIVGFQHVVFFKTAWGWPVNLAMKMVYEDIFDKGYRKIATYCFSDNFLMIGLAKRLGSKQEGILRQHALRNNELVDIIVLGLTKEDYYAMGSIRNDGSKCCC